MHENLLSTHLHDWILDHPAIGGGGGGGGGACAATREPIRTNELNTQPLECCVLGAQNTKIRQSLSRLIAAG